MYNFSNVKAAHQRNFELTKSKDFASLAVNELRRKRKLEAVRIHDGGDIYSKPYLVKWMLAANRMPETQFYFYTKRVSLIKNNRDIIPDNVTVIFSYGGKEDHLIDPNTDRHSYVFRTKEQLERNGYVDASHDDTVAWKSDNHRIGLLLH
jgi:hypothetical protein